MSKKRLPKLPEDEHQKIRSESKTIAHDLSERNRMLIYMICRTIGTEAARSLLERTKEIIESGGMETLDKSRLRTPGGTFFRLAKDLYPEIRIFSGRGGHHERNA